MRKRRPGPSAAAARRESEERFRKIFDHSHDAIFVIDPEQDRILDANARAGQMLGYSREELLALPVSAIHPHQMPAVMAFARSVVEHGSGWTNELSCVTKSGECLPTEMSASVFDIGGRNLLLGLVRDMSDRKRAERMLQEYATNLEGLVNDRSAQLRESEQRHRVLLQVNNAIVSNLEREPLFDAITGALRTVLDFDRASLTLRGPSPGISTVYALAESPPSRGVLQVGSEIPRQDERIVALLRQGRPVRIPDLGAEPAGRPEHKLSLEGFQSAVIAPLLTRRGAFGTLNLASRTPNRYSEADADLLAQVAGQIAFAVENMLAFEEIRRLKAGLEQENVYLREEASSERGLNEILGHSAAMKRVLKAVGTVGATSATVLITGETGTGKELVARAVHDSSLRRGKTMVTVNCAALPAGLIESELFGHEKGAFTGALARKIGRFELADGGTLFLDEIGDLPLELQAKLLRVLQDGEFQRVGGSHTMKVDVRLIAATNQDLEKAMQAGRFRPDLYYRLNVFPIALPALRERKEDILLLVRHLVMRHATRMGKRIETLTDAVMEQLLSYSWPGNVRELENVIERAVILTPGPRLELGEWLRTPAAGPVSSGFPTLEEVQRRHVLEALEATGWRVSGESGAAKLLGLKPTTLEARMKRLAITRPR